MAVLRASTFRRAFQSLRPLRTSVGKPQPSRQIGRRGYASHGHETKQASSDIPWAIGAVVVTVPSVWYILQSGPENAHGHEDHHDDHGDGDGHKEEKPDVEDSEDSDKDSQKSDDSDSDDEKTGADTPATLKGDGEDDEKDLQGNPEGVADDAKSQSNDELVSSKPAGSQNSQSGKQENLSNADTKHSTDLKGDTGKSKKGEGSPETSKTKGTVDPKRPQA